MLGIEAALSVTSQTPLTHGELCGDHDIRLMQEDLHRKKGGEEFL